MKPLTERQRAVLAYVRDYMAQHRVAPSIGNIANALAISSTSSVSYTLVSLRQRDYLLYEPSLARSLALTHNGLKAIAGVQEVEREKKPAAPAKAAHVPTRQQAQKARKRTGIRYVAVCGGDVVQLGMVGNIDALRGVVDVLRAAGYEMAEVAL